jgi:hypothetical protein
MFHQNAKRQRRKEEEVNRAGRFFMVLLVTALLLKRVENYCSFTELIITLVLLIKTAAAVSEPTAKASSPRTVKMVRVFRSRESTHKYLTVVALISFFSSVIKNVRYVCVCVCGVCLCVCVCVCVCVQSSKNLKNE